MFLYPIKCTIYFFIAFAPNLTDKLFRFNSRINFKIKKKEYFEYVTYESVNSASSELKSRIYKLLNISPHLDPQSNRLPKPNLLKPLHNLKLFTPFKARNQSI